MSLIEKRKKIAKLFFQKGLLLTPEILRRLETVPRDQLSKTIEEEYEETQSYETKDGALLASLKRQAVDPALSQEQVSVKPKSNLDIVFNYQDSLEKKNLTDFVSLFNNRYQKLKSMLLQRQELKNSTSIGRVLERKEREFVSVIGLVDEKIITKNGNIMITLEDPTGKIRVLFSKNKETLFNMARDLLLDETIGIVGTSGNQIIFANNLLYPEIPLTKELKKCPNEVFAAFISDIHIGSNEFLEEQFKKFLNWTNGQAGSDDHKIMASKLGYLFIGGDMVDGVGIYPNQDKDLTLTDIGKQYQKTAELLSKVPDHIQIVMIPGNHDACRIAEPQMPTYYDYSKELYEMKNVSMLSNPSMINIENDEGPGIDVLLYHGYSFDYYAANVESIRNAGGYDRPDLIMKMLLQRRHLAPTHTSTLYIPDKHQDPLIIDRIPDLFQTGHIHRTRVANYRNITMINSSCWQSITDFQVRTGHVPEPGRVPLVNLKTRDVKILRF